MSLKDVPIKTEYRSPVDNVATDFFIPLLKQAVLYKRAVGFFSSSALVQISIGISAMAKNNGKILIVASPFLSDSDVEAICKGYELRDCIIKKALVRELKETNDLYEQERLNLLANLIADGVLDIKIAFTEDEKQLGIYHEKMGIISDVFGNKVAFSGSMNESLTAMTLNYETIDVYYSWDDKQKRVEAKEKAFTSIWNDCEPNIRIIDFPELKQEIINKYKKPTVNYDIDKVEFEDNNKLIKDTKCLLWPAIPPNIELHDYQKEAISEWEKRDYKGIFDMATGTGKTFTGLGAIVKLSDKLSGKLAVVIVCPYQHLVEQWVEDIVKFNINPIIGFSASTQRNWKDLLKDAIRDQKVGVDNKEFFCFICTNATFSSKFVQTQIQNIESNALLVVDEAHNFGAEYLSRLLSEKFTYRLALSATFERHNDEEGTAKLFSYFGEKCIEYTLERAIEEKKLTRYKYFPIIVMLNDEELCQYLGLSFEIGKCMIKDKNGKTKLSKKGKILALRRARLVAGAENKVAKLEEYITPYLHDSHILVYCGATKVVNKNEDITSVDDDDLRQIDVITDLLGNKLNMKVSQFTSKEDVKEREILKKEFAEGDNLQALIAIKCLDEGVNIPKIKVAFILASTTNPKEYIQRRGRVLRLAEGKEYAEIYDFLTLPRPLDEVPSLTVEQMKKEISLVKNELNRAEEFARIAMNRIEAESVIDEIKEAYLINDFIIKFEEDYGYE